MKPWQQTWCTKLKNNKTRISPQVEKKENVLTAKVRKLASWRVYQYFTVKGKEAFWFWKRLGFLLSGVGEKCCQKSLFTAETEEQFCLLSSFPDALPDGCWSFPSLQSYPRLYGATEGKERSRWISMTTQNWFQLIIIIYNAYDFMYPYLPLKLSLLCF